MLLYFQKCIIDNYVNQGEKNMGLESMFNSFSNSLISQNIEKASDEQLKAFYKNPNVDRKTKDKIENLLYRRGQVKLLNELKYGR